METVSMMPAKIAGAFIKAKRAFGPALKDKTNPAFRSKYADLGACIEAVEDALLANGIVFIQQTFEDPSGVTVETVFMHESGEAIRCGKLHVPASKQDPQGYGSALTYARRYSLMASCGIAPEDDDGNAASKPRGTVQAVTTGSMRSSPTMGILDTLEPARRAVVDDYAESIKERFAKEDIVGAYQLAAEVQDSEEKTALWSLLDSKCRAAIKKHAESLKTPLKAAA